MLPILALCVLAGWLISRPVVHAIECLRELGEGEAT